MARILELHPADFAANLALGELYFNANLAFACYAAGRSNDAILHAEWCLNRQPDFHKVRLILAQARRDKGEFEASMENLQTVVDAEPDNLDAALLHADLLFFRGDGRLVYDRLIPFYDQHQKNRNAAKFAGKPIEVRIAIENDPVKRLHRRH